MNTALCLMRLHLGTEYFTLDEILRCGFRKTKIFPIVILRNTVSQKNDRTLYQLNKKIVHLQRIWNHECEMRQKKGRIKRL